MKRSLRISLFTLTVALLFTSTATACPTCSEALAEQTSDAARLGEGFSWSILMMLGVPASLVGVGGVAVHRAVKRGVLPEF